MLLFGVTVPVTVPQRSEIPEGLMNNPVYIKATPPPGVKHNAQNNTHTYCNTSETNVYFDFFV
jgi:Tfp pilus assembly protein PilE